MIFFQIDVVGLVAATPRVEKRKLSVEGGEISTPAKLPKLSPTKSTPDRLSTGPAKLKNTKVRIKSYLLTYFLAFPIIFFLMLYL